ncbi:hypothetical protein SCLCIDRAFT_22663 [Scleroderma citrinum Foug A]|uniref:Uncharacterized protein n=1 Tax=Scleroderma citrinum Foug A TaxID=1036808 RepID=A0A0C2ZVE0_9AGAM|nr:hypothetical protein SCLCIDRAFT_22663 [Scleroderma citrinum Foug A]
MHDTQNWSILGGFQPSALHGLQQPMSAMHDTQQLALGAQSATSASLDIPTSLLSISALDIAAFDESFKNPAFWNDLDRFITLDLNGGQTVSSTHSSSFTNMLSSMPLLFNSFSSPLRPRGQLEFSSPLCLPVPAFSSPPHLPALSFSLPAEEVVQLSDPEDHLLNESSSAIQNKRSMKQGKKSGTSAMLSTTGPSKTNSLPQVERLSVSSNATELPTAGEVTRKSSRASVPSTCNALANAIGSSQSKENITHASTAGWKRGADAVENSMKKYTFI